LPWPQRSALGLDRQACPSTGLEVSDEFPETDDFRLEREDEGIVVTFTPDGRSYAFPVEGDQVGEPTVSPARTDRSDFADDEVCRTAAELPRLALKGSP